MKYSLILLAAAVFCTDLLAGTTVAADAPYVRSPRSVGGGAIVYTDNYSSALYLRRADGSTTQLAVSPGAGMYFTVSPDRASIGMKLIGADGLQTPAVIDAATGTLRALCEPAAKAGQVSFTSDGRCAYTLGTQLIVGSGSDKRTIELGTYANIAPISPDGRFAAYNTDDDQLWTIDIVTGAKTRITDGRVGYFQPQWSPDNSRILYSSLGGSVFTYDRASGATSAIGEGLSPVWSDDGAAIAFYRTETADGELVNSDLYVAMGDSTTVRRITNTPDVCEMDPSFVPGAPMLIYQTSTRSEIRTCAVSAAASPALQKLPAGASVMTAAQVIPVPVTPHVTSVPVHTTRLLDVPYVNQVFDTPDWFNGHSACGPTTAVMALAYYNILPIWPTSCAGPTRHINNWGSYVSEIYTFRGITYNGSANDPNGRPGQGAFGYMWSGGSPYSCMSSYYGNHWISSSIVDAPSHASATAEIAGGYLYSICNALTTAGHIVQAHDIDATESHTIIVNDPYGDKNKPGYPNYYGKNAPYDWPGYNNGHQNFNTVWWAATVHYTPPAPPDSIVDDLQVDNGFYMNVKSPASYTMWRYKLQGYKSHFTYLLTTSSTDIDTCYGTWTPTLDKTGRYEVFASLPYFSAPFASGAKYKIFSKEGMTVVTVDQKAIGASITADTLVSLGTFSFDKGNTGYVRLGDAASGVKREPLIFDAMMWKYRGDIETAVTEHTAQPAGFSLGQNFPNPFNPSTLITYSLPASAHVDLTIADALGRECAVLVNATEGQGEHRISWNAGAFPAGVYFCRMHAVGVGAGPEGGAYTSIKKMILLK
jgi:hypothetical protein